MTQKERKIIQKGQQRRDAEKNVRSEYLKILKDQSHPLYDQVAFGDLTLDKFKQQYQSPAATPPAAAPAAAVGPRFADLRGSATPGSSTPASGAKPSGGGMFQPGGLFGGPSNVCKIWLCSIKRKVLFFF
jgi:hypothetical protein